jgi:hypothetical protein
MHPVNASNDSMTSEETRVYYLRYLRQYCEAVGKNPDELIELKTLGMQNVATDLEFGAEKLLENFLYNDKEVKAKPNVAFRNSKSSKKFLCFDYGKDVRKNSWEEN